MRGLRCGSLVMVAAAMIAGSHIALAQHVTAQMKADDDRLRHPVTVSCPSIYLGDQLARLSKVSGVAISMNSRDDASGTRVSAYLTNVSLADAMDAVWSLNSYRGAEWFWVREGAVGRYSYHLVVPLKARDLAATLRDAVQNAYVKQAEFLMSAAKLTPEERKNLTADAATLPLLRDDRCMQGIAIFGSALTDDQRSQVLGSDTIVVVPIETLSAGSQAYVASEFAASQSTRPAPTKLFVYTSRSGPEIAPSLTIEIEGIGGYGYAGGAPMNDQFVSDLRGNWILDGDKLDDPALTRTIDRTPLSPISSTENLSSDAVRTLSLSQRSQWRQSQRRVAQRRLEQTAEGGRLSLVALLPRWENNLPLPYGQTVGAYLDFLRHSPLAMMWKWRNGVLIGCYQTWFMGSDSVVPMDIIENLRAESKDGTRDFSLDDLVRAATALSAQQLRYVSETFPVMSTVANTRALYVLSSEHPEMRTSQGVLKTPEVLAVLRSVLGTQLSADIEKAVSFSLVEGSDIQINVVRHVVRLRLLAANGAEVGRLSFEISDTNGAR